VAIPQEIEGRGFFFGNPRILKKCAEMNMP
jgi:hypothetical protein